MTTALSNLSVPKLKPKRQVCHGVDPLAFPQKNGGFVCISDHAIAEILIREWTRRRRRSRVAFALP